MITGRLIFRHKDRVGQMCKLQRNIAERLRVSICRVCICTRGDLIEIVGLLNDNATSVQRKILETEIRDILQRDGWERIGDPKMN